MECASAWKKFKVQYGEQGGGNGKTAFTSCCCFYCIAMFVCRVSHIDARNLKAIGDAAVLGPKNQPGHGGM